MENIANPKQTDGKGNKMNAEKIIYKNQKRRNRNRVIYLACLHILYIFIFVGLLCVEYLIPRNWVDSFLLSVVADGLFGVYILSILVAIKFKHRKMLIIAIMSLILSIGIKGTATAMLLSQDSSPLVYLLMGHVIFLVFNIAVPLCLLLIWNKLKESKWRETFDLHTKLNSHLLKGDLDSQENIK